MPHGAAEVDLDAGVEEASLTHHHIDTEGTRVDAFEAQGEELLDEQRDLAQELDINMFSKDGKFFLFGQEEVALVGTVDGGEERQSAILHPTLRCCLVLEGKVHDPLAFSLGDDRALLRYGAVNELCAMRCKPLYPSAAGAPRCLDDGAAMLTGKLLHIAASVAHGGGAYGAWEGSETAEHLDCQTTVGELAYGMQLLIRRHQSALHAPLHEFSHHCLVPSPDAGLSLLMP